MVRADNFSAVNDTAMIQAAIDYAADNNVKTVELIDRDYSITSPIVIKEGVLLKFSYGSRFIVSGNFRVLELQRNSSLIGAYIAIDDRAFNSPVIYLDGKYKYYNSWFKTQVKDVTIVNWSGSHKGTGIHLYANGPGHEISFVPFENVKLVGLNIGVFLQAVQTQGGYSYVNANTFNDIVIDDCVKCISLVSGETIPNECSGNTFSNLQIQLSSATTNILLSNGQYNVFGGMSWDLSNVSHNRSLVQFTSTSSYNVFAIRNVPLSRITDNGRNNKKEIL
ncbi:hypothetical protein [Pseudalkalibacillus hwajinpoensis]|uniref:Pectate lyase superfamily protein domain-containing protein n=1 Tax=Guptibacillus hwajinpoensis TaxID=208199 RepID=A0A4U1MJQ6_9BACL|nr:hypothetical protein [Pseudalkalibacillus hwajinpoensis]TKD70805.1 hypothetical protein FBF83_09335 [Pseudalkalibacillus hwajinpoensis]